MFTNQSTTVKIQTAARRVQRMWKRSQKKLLSKEIVTNFFSMMGKVKTISFNELVVHLKDKAVIAAAKSCLQRIHLLTTFRHGSPSFSQSHETVNVRVFLAAYMISMHQYQVFESMGQLEQALFDAAGPLVETFHAICTAITSSPTTCFRDVPHNVSKDFPSMLSTYLSRFKAWKVPDEAKLSCRIKHALVALYQAQSSLPLDEPVGSKLRVEFRDQINRLRGKLSQIAGSDALAQFDREQSIGSTQEDIVGSGGGGGHSKSSAAAFAALPGRMTNEQLAHELLFDPNFQLGPDGSCVSESPSLQRIRQTFHRAFWDSLVDDLRPSAGGRPCFVRVLRVLAEICDGLADLSGGRESATVDLELIRQQAERGLLGWEDCVGLVGTVVGAVRRVQEPRRAEETESGWGSVREAMEGAASEDRERSLCKALEYLLDRVNILRIDAANMRLRLIAPVIMDHGYEYEQGKLQEKLKEGSMTLERTKRWILRALQESAAASGGTLAPGIAHGKASAYKRLLADAILALVDSTELLQPASCPETLLFDVQRIRQLQTEFERAATCAAIMATAAAFLSKDVDGQQLLSKIAEVLSSELQGDWRADQVLDHIASLLQESALDQPVRGHLCRALACNANPTDAVRKLMVVRMRSAWAGVLESDLPLELPPSIPRVLLPGIEKSLAVLKRVYTINLGVHTQLYNGVIREAVEQCGI